MLPGGVCAIPNDFTKGRERVQITAVNRFFVIVLLLVSTLASSACYTTSATRRSERIVAGGTDFDVLGPWVLVTGPLSVVVAGATWAVNSVVPISGGVDPREPSTKWFAGYAGPLREASQVGFLCHRDSATWVTGIRSSGDAAWQSAREERWHFPVCLEVPPGRYELEVHYFARQHDDDRELSVSHQAESTEPSIIVWESVGGQVDTLAAEISSPLPSTNLPPQRHIPRSRALGTTWWELEESQWFARIDRQGRWDELGPPVTEQRAAWAAWRQRQLP